MDDKLKELLLSVKELYEEFKVIEKEILNNKLFLSSDNVDKDNIQSSKECFPAKKQYDRLGTMEENIRGREKSLDSLIWDFCSGISDLIKEQKERLINVHFPIAPTYKCKKQYCEAGSHSLSIDEGEVIKICGVDFSNDELYVTAKTDGYDHEYGIPYDDLLDNFLSII